MHCSGKSQICFSNNTTLIQNWIYEIRQELRNLPVLCSHSYFLAALIFIAGVLGGAIILLIQGLFKELVVFFLHTINPQQLIRRDGIFTLECKIIYKVK